MGSLFLWRIFKPPCKISIFEIDSFCAHITNRAFDKEETKQEVEKSNHQNYRKRPPKKLSPISFSVLAWYLCWLRPCAIQSVVTFVLNFFCSNLVCLFWWKLFFSRIEMAKLMLSLISLAVVLLCNIQNAQGNHHLNLISVRFTLVKHLACVFRVFVVLGL